MFRTRVLRIGRPAFFLVFSFAVLAGPRSIAQSINNSIQLDKEAVFLPCYEFCKSRSGSCGDGPSERIVKILGASHGESLTEYRFTVSTGRIVKTADGPSWDLNGAAAGSYEITASPKQPKERFGKTARSMVVVRECPDCICDVDCPSISVNGPTVPVYAGQSMVFTASVLGGSQDTIEYHWRVSEGSIVSGQDTQSVTIKTNKKMAGTQVKVTVEISLNEIEYRHGCPNTKTAEVKIAADANPGAARPAQK